jgi:hypothetical protein
VFGMDDFSLGDGWDWKDGKFPEVIDFGGDLG